MPAPTAGLLLCGFLQAPLLTLVYVRLRGCLLRPTLLGRTYGPIRGIVEGEDILRPGTYGFEHHE